MSQTTPETSDLRDRLAEALGRHVYVPCAEITATTRAFWAQCEGCDWKGPRRTNRDAPEGDHDAHQADALLPVVAQEIAAAEQRGRASALREAAVEIERVERVGLTPTGEIAADEREWFNAHRLRNVDGYQRHRPVVAAWLRDRADTLAEPAPGEHP